VIGFVCLEEVVPRSSLTCKVLRKKLESRNNCELKVVHHPGAVAGTGEWKSDRVFISMVLGARGCGFERPGKNLGRRRK